jgi:predicted transcriptional regulator
MSFELLKWARGVKGLSPPEKAVLKEIADRTNDEKGYAWPSQQRLAEDTGYERSTVSRACNSLRDKGLLSWKKEMTPNGRFSSNCYVIHRVAPSHKAEICSTVLQNATSPCGTAQQKPLAEHKELTLREGNKYLANSGSGQLTHKQLNYVEKLAHQYHDKYKDEFFQFDKLFEDMKRFLASKQTEEDWLRIGNGLPSPKQMGWI